MVRKFISRVIVFEFDDGHGGKSHTFMEVWLPDEKKWVYVDPHYNAIAKLNTIQLIEDHSSIELLPISDELTRNKELEDAFVKGHFQWYIETSNPLRRIEFLTNS
jgi:hypothetical protein